MGTPTQFGSEEHCPIQTQALKILIASSFNTSIQHQGIKMCKTSTLDGTTKEVYVGEYMNMNLSFGNIQMLL